MKYPDLHTKVMYVNPTRGLDGGGGVFLQKFWL